MKSYQINKGIGRTVEFKGLKAQYLFIFSGGLLLILLLVMILHILGAESFLCLLIGSILSSLLIWQTFALNRKYGQYGLMKKNAGKRHPRYIISRKRARNLLSKPFKSNR